MQSNIKLPKRIGVIHLPPLVGAPSIHGLEPAEALARAGLLAVKEATVLSRAGFDGIIIENFGDAPFYKDQVPPETIACMAIIAAAIREVSSAKLGINILRNDARSALAVAAVTSADFIRVNILSGVAATDQGIIEGQASFLIRERSRLGALKIALMADVQVKHARSLSSDDLELSIEENIGRAAAAGIIITGPTTGRQPDLGKLAIAGKTCKKLGVPLYIGSGSSAENLKELSSASGLGKDLGFIVGSSIRSHGLAGYPLDQKRIKAFIAAIKTLSKSKKAKKK